MQTSDRYPVTYVLALAIALLTSVMGASVAARGEASPGPTGRATAEPMHLEVGCSYEAPCPLSAGTWELTGRYSFILGMQITVPDGWESREQDAGEFNLFPVGDFDTEIVMVKDIAAVINDGSGDLAPGVPQTVDGLTSFWRSHPDLVVSEPVATTIAGLPATTFTIAISPDAQSGDTLCPAHPLCADLFTDPRYWDGPFGFIAPYVARFYLANISNGGDEHLLAIILVAADETALDRLTEETGPMLDSIRLPESFPIW